MEFQSLGRSLREKKRGTDLLAFAIGLRTSIFVWAPVAWDAKAQRGKEERFEKERGPPKVRSKVMPSTSASRSRDDGVIDLVGVLDTTAWIGHDKKWPANPPGVLIGALMDKLAMPKDILAPRFPISPTTPVREFVKIDLPNPTSDFVTGNPKLWFSRDTPLTDVRIVLDPSDLKQSTGQQREKKSLAKIKCLL
ncbi:hypothetical protein B0H14DRAFT_2567566 [Mycena olivaceomarginata]|nr:hypothetical protein B0H14DRAFT_2567566 [Mycena olivaceomarginata]